MYSLSYQERITRKVEWKKRLMRHIGGLLQLKETGYLSIYAEHNPKVTGCFLLLSVESRDPYNLDGATYDLPHCSTEPIWQCVTILNDGKILMVDIAEEHISLIGAPK